MEDVCLARVAFAFDAHDDIITNLGGHLTLQRVDGYSTVAKQMNRTTIPYKQPDKIEVVRRVYFCLDHYWFLSVFAHLAFRFRSARRQDLQRRAFGVREPPLIEHQTAGREYAAGSGAGSPGSTSRTWMNLDKSNEGFKGGVYANAGPTSCRKRYQSIAFGGAGLRR